MVLPHLRRACDMDTRIKQARRETTTLKDALNRVSDAVAILDRDGRVIFSNPSANAIFRVDNGVSLTRDERLLLTSSEARVKLAQGLSRCAGSSVWTPDHGVSPPDYIAVYRQDGQPLILTLHPLSKCLAGDFGAVALLFICELGREKTNQSPLLRNVYGLTTAELHLAQAICEGVKLKRYAESRQISYESARTYLRRIFDKTGARRQSDLASLVRRLR